MKRFVLLLLLLALPFGIGCRAEYAVGTMMESFAEMYPLSGRILCTEAYAQDEDFLDPKRLRDLYGEEMPSALSVALWLTNRADVPSECALFHLRDRDDAYRMATLGAERIAYLREQYPTLEGEVLRSGEYVVYYVLPDLSRARRLWRRIL